MGCQPRISARYSVCGTFLMQVWIDCMCILPTDELLHGIKTVQPYKIGFCVKVTQLG